MALDNGDDSRKISVRKKAVETAFRVHNRLLVNWLTQKFNDSDTAQDIAQNAYLRVWRYAENNEIDNPRALIFKTAANLAANEFRARRRTPITQMTAAAAVQDFLESVASDAPSPERTTEAKQDLQASMRAISALPQRTRRAFIQSRFMGKNYREIAQELNVSESSVEKYIISALKSLREAVKRNSKGATVIDLAEKVAAAREK